MFLAEDFLGFCMESFGERKRETGFYMAGALNLGFVEEDGVE